MKSVNYKSLNNVGKLLRLSIAISLTAFIVPSTAFAASPSSSEPVTHSLGNKVDDQTLEYKVNQILGYQLPEASFTVVSYGQKILLAGQVPTALDKTKAVIAVTNTTGVNKVWNYLTVGENEDSKDIAKDAYLTSAAKTRLIAQKGVNTNNIKVVTSNKVVYLLGNNAGDPAQLKAAIVGIKGISDVHDVVNLIGQ